MPRLINDKQRAFAVAYSKTGNARNSALSAGYSEKTAHVAGHNLRKNKLVAAEIARLTAKIEKRSELSVQKVTEKLASLLDANIQDLHNPETGELLPVHKWPRELAAAVQSIDGGKIRMSSTLGAIELAAKLLGMVKQQDTFAPVQIIIAAPPELPPAPAAPALPLLPCWDDTPSSR